MSSVLPLSTVEHTTLAVDDTIFNENLHNLYERRVLGTRECLEALDYERTKILNRQALIQSMRNKV